MLQPPRSEPHCCFSFYEFKVVLANSIEIQEEVRTPFLKSRSF